MNIATNVILADTWGMHGDDFGVGWMIVMMLGMVLFWGAIILGIVWLVRGSLGGWREGRAETPAEILERRFAEGAISVDEYRERREAITTGTHGPHPA
jgi:putative membrane protein